MLGKSEHAWGLELTGFGRPFGLGHDADGRLHVVDMDTHWLVRVDASWESFEWHDGRTGWNGPWPIAHEIAPRRPRSSPTGWNGPHSIAFGASGSLYVTCYHGAAVHIISADGNPLGEIGRGLLTGPATGFFDGSARLLVAEYSQNGVLAFDAQGRHLGTLGLDADGHPLRFEATHAPLPASSRPGGFDRLHMVREQPDGTLIVADTWNDRLQRFSSQGDFMDCRIGSHGKPLLRQPVAVDPGLDGSLLITEWGRHRVSLFRADGTVASSTRPELLEHPYDARRTPNGFVIADTHHGRVLAMSRLDAGGREHN